MSCKLAAKLQDHKGDIKGIYHFTAQESITKYQVCGKFFQRNVNTQ